MRHYDGPAFYRRQNKKTKQITNKEISEPLAKVVIKKGQTFHPSYVPPSLASRKYSLQKRKQKYQMLFESLQKEEKDYFLFDETADSEKSEIKNITETGVTGLPREKEINKADVVDKKVIDETIEIAESRDNAKDIAVTNINQQPSENKSVQVNDKKFFEQEKQGYSNLMRSSEEVRLSEPEKPESILEQETKISSAIPAAKLMTQTSSYEPRIKDLDLTENEEENSANTTVKPVKSPEEESQRINVVGEYKFPVMDLLPKPVRINDDTQDEWVLEQIDTLNETLEAFHVEATVKDWTIGPAVTQFELSIGRGVKVNKITNLIDDLKLALAAKDIRIEAPIPGRSSVGIEIPNLKARPVMLAEVLNSAAFVNKKSPLTVALGVNLSGESIVTDLRKMPHGLIAGATGSGKSVFINSILISLLYKATPQQVKLLLIDPKAVEMAPYHDIPHLLAPVVSDPVAASAALKWVVEEMEERYQKLAAAGVRNIEEFNEKAIQHEDYGLQIPYIVIIIDELADLMMVASSEVQDYIARITQKARAAGIHLLIATQRPSVDVITGTIKNNIPTRVAFMVASQVDSRTIIDTAGAERLLGRGDMLYLGNGASQPMRLQGTFVQNEVEKITDFVRAQGRPNYAFDPDGLKKKNIQNKQEDEILPEVLDCIVNEDSISTSKLQRIFAIGYNRAANIIDTLEERRYISPTRGSKPREVYLTQEGLEKLRSNVND
ncbi:MAG: DNA translocase FtsK [Liquorilactobacillus hordei]|uniref:DNA translocase FtsK n=1 Tax=Liquorilactobacillus hordei TaxID=468911 RepID=UPI0039EC224C